LVNLIELYLSHNQLTAVPPEIRQLVNLTELYFSDNQLEFLPTALTHLPRLKKLHLYGNPLPIPTELIGTDWRSAKTDPQPIFEAYFQQCAPLNQLKLLILGEGKWAKPPSSNVSCTTSPPATAAKPSASTSTHRNRSSPSKTDPKIKIINVWDFGGQEIYHATHQFFLSHRSLYLCS
jgi:internalin A